MNDILTTMRQRFVKGLRGATYEFVAATAVFGRAVPLGLRALAQQLDTATADARAKASRSSKHHE